MNRTTLLELRALLASVLSFIDAELSAATPPHEPVNVCHRCNACTPVAGCVDVYRPGVPVETVCRPCMLDRHGEEMRRAEAARDEDFHREEDARERAAGRDE